MSRSPSYRNSVTWMSTVHSFAAFFFVGSPFGHSRAQTGHTWLILKLTLQFSEIVWVECPVNNRMLNLLARAPAAGTSIFEQTRACKFQQTKTSNVWDLPPSCKIFLAWITTQSTLSVACSSKFHMRHPPGGSLSAIPYVYPSPSTSKQVAGRVACNCTHIKYQCLSTPHKSSEGLTSNFHLPAENITKSWANGSWVKMINLWNWFE